MDECIQPRTTAQAAHDLLESPVLFCCSKCYIMVTKPTLGSPPPNKTSHWFCCCGSTEVTLFFAPVGKMGVEAFALQLPMDRCFVTKPAWCGAYGFQGHRRQNWMQVCNRVQNCMHVQLRERWGFWKRGSRKVSSYFRGHPSFEHTHPLHAKGFQLRTQCCCHVCSTACVTLHLELSENISLTPLPRGNNGEQQMHASK